MIASAANSGGPLFVFAGGGTGGHLYPSIAVAEAIRRLCPGARFAFWGTTRAIDRRILEQIDAAFVAQRLPAFSVLPWRLAGALVELRAARRVCREQFERDRPAAVMGTGGMASVPPAQEAARMGIPVALFNPDAVPGRANRHLARLADRVFVQFAETTAYFPRDVGVEITGCPVRPAFASASREEGIARFGLDPSRRTLLVTGASLGARSVNEAVVANADFLASRSDWQVLHLTGEADQEMVASAYRRISARARVCAYTEAMASAMAASDLIVSRAGASTLAEILAARRPAILMPYPHHRDQHQMMNARCAARFGVIRIVRDLVDASANGPKLREALQAMMDRPTSEPSGMPPDRRDEGVGSAADRIARRLLELSSWSERPSSGRTAASSPNR